MTNARVYDLGQPYFLGMPHFPTHPPFMMSLTKRHGDYVLSNGVSSAADAITLGTHTGTHIDALCHFSRDGKLHGGIEAEPIHDYDCGFQQLSVETIEPIVRRGVLLDVAGALGMDALPVSFVITPEHLEAAMVAKIEEGDVVLLRTGWGRFFADERRFITGGNNIGPSSPGPEEAGARWLSERKIFAAGSDTVAFERMPSPGMTVHSHLLVDCGIYIIECLNLEELARDQVCEFTFIASPLKLRGATGAPVRPLALRSAG